MDGKHWNGWEHVDPASGPDPDSIWGRAVTDDGCWVVWGRFVQAYGHLDLAEVRIFPNDESTEKQDYPPGEWTASSGGGALGTSAPSPGRITTSILRNVRIGDLYADMERRLTNPLTGSLDPQKIGGLAAAVEVDRANLRKRTRRRQKNTTLRYARYAKEFTELFASFSGRKGWNDVMAKMAERYERSTKTVEGWYQQCRQLGYITAQHELTELGRDRASHVGERRYLTPPTQDPNDF